MGNIKKSMTCLLLIGSAASAFISFNVQAEGNGVIVLDRDVFKVSDDELFETKVLNTFFSGKQI